MGTAVGTLLPLGVLPSAAGDVVEPQVAVAPREGVLAQRLTAPDGDFRPDAFGGAVAVDGDTAVVGAFARRSAYIYVRTQAGWRLQQGLKGGPNAGFGAAVAVDGDTAVIGSTLGGADDGPVFVYVRSGQDWTLQAELTAPDSGFGLFGYSVGISGDTMVVGDFLARPDGESTGAAYVYTRSGTAWTLRAELAASDGEDGDSLGVSVAVAGATVLVGASAARTPHGLERGAVYVFVRSGTTWTQQAKLFASDGGRAFGAAVDLEGDTAVVGAPEPDVILEQYGGSAYVFVRSGTVWTQQDKLTQTEDMPDDFGDSVAVGGNTIVVGAPQATTARGVGAGAAFVFIRSGTAWAEQVRLAPPAFDTDNWWGEFGASVAVSGRTTMIGGPKDVSEGDVGSVYVLEGNVLGLGATAAASAQAEAPA